MNPTIVIQALGYSLIGLLAGLLLGLLLISSRREYMGGGSLAARIHLALVLASLCGFIALSTVYWMAAR